MGSVCVRCDDFSIRYDFIQMCEAMANKKEMDKYMSRNIELCDDDDIDRRAHKYNRRLGHQFDNRQCLYFTGRYAAHECQPTSHRCGEMWSNTMANTALYIHIVYIYRICLSQTRTSQWYTFNCVLCYIRMPNDWNVPAFTRNNTHSIHI